MVQRRRRPDGPFSRAHEDLLDYRENRARSAADVERSDAVFVLGLSLATAALYLVLRHLVGRR